MQCFSNVSVCKRMAIVWRAILSRLITRVGPEQVILRGAVEATYSVEVEWELECLEMTGLEVAG